MIGDTTLAIDNFLEFGLEGHAERNDFGEKYLRLYGVFNESYLQQFAVFSLYKRCNLSKPKDVIEKLEKLKIYELRNKLGAHSPNYKNKQDDKKQDLIECYVIIRISAKGYNFEYINNESSEREWVDIKECLEEHLILCIDLLDTVYAKYIKTINNGEDNKKEEQNTILLELLKLKEEIIPN